MKLGRVEGGGEPQLGRIGKGVQVSGDVIFSDELQVDGKLKGTLTSENGTLVIDQSGQVEAGISVGVCVIRGSLKGDVKARSRVEIYGSARVNGDISTPVLLIEEGAVVSGAIVMGEEPSKRKLEEAPPDTSDPRRKGISA
jgi:cytoskeletal protein CcmA (bactofilin family)